MTQNRSTAVMARRRPGPTSLEYFPTPAWATRALCEFIGRQHTEHHVCWEPACGEGHMARPLGEYFRAVYASDCHNYGFGTVEDFLWYGAGNKDFDWIITNPPFKLAMRFAHLAIDRAKVGVAMFARLQFLEGQTRHEKLFRPYPPTWILQFCERVPLLEGRIALPRGMKRKGEHPDRSATAYCWVLWSKPSSRHTTKFHWIAPCRAKLEREEDYADNRDQNSGNFARNDRSRSAALARAASEISP